VKFKMKGIFGEDGKIHPVEDGDDWILDVDDYGPLMVKEKKTYKESRRRVYKICQMVRFIP
jgi:hypothetical protein